jgi:threonine synthase
MYLRCSSGSCTARLDLHAPVLACPACGDLLEVALEPLSLKPAQLKQTWRERRTSDDPRDRSGVWRFREFLPGPYAQVVTLAEGNISLVRGQRAAEWAGLSNLQFKHLGWNPTGSFKDLGMTVGITEAKHIGARAVACASTGNTSASMAAYAARAGIEAHVYVPKGAVSPAKMAQALDYGSRVIEIEGSFDDALQTLIDRAGSDLYFLNSINPFRIEGQKTVMFELMEQLGWNPPDYLVLPGGNLGNTSAFGKAMMELHAHGFISKVPKFVVVQAEGANPFARMWKTGADNIEPVAEPRTAATAIRIGNPKSWRKALRAVRFTSGLVMDVSDAEIGEAKAIIGRDGIGCEPASATTLAALRKLTGEGKVERDAVVVAILTGHVLKDTDYIIKSHAKAAAEEMVGLETR